MLSLTPPLPSSSSSSSSSNHFTDIQVHLNYINPIQQIIQSFQHFTSAASTNTTLFSSLLSPPSSLSTSITQQAQQAQQTHQTQSDLTSSLRTLFGDVQERLSSASFPISTNCVQTIERVIPKPTAIISPVFVILHLYSNFHSHLPYYYVYHPIMFRKNGRI